MNKIFLVTCFLFFVSGCTVENSSNIDFNAQKISYHKDYRTDLCYAVTASKKAMDPDTTGLGISEVPCTQKVLDLIEK